MKKPNQTTINDRHQTLVSVTEHLTAIEATVSALAVALDTSGSTHTAEVARTLRDFVSPQLRTQMKALSLLIASSKASD